MQQTAERRTPRRQRLTYQDVAWLRQSVDVARGLQTMGARQVEVPAIDVARDMLDRSLCNERCDVPASVKDWLDEPRLLWMQPCAGTGREAVVMGSRKTPGRYIEAAKRWALAWVQNGRKPQRLPVGCTVHHRPYPPACESDRGHLEIFLPLE